ncbi:right-handed parallel beta-helix repeat-containing protein [Rothia sp. LK2588]|uniref:right-handed parallel beta-helix repeat-containing protein n=1 Tax=Rothia sp. LK2588 TaxID=3114369 RepID=UPI0034CDF560
MVSRAQFLAASTLGVVLASSTPASGVPTERMLIVTEHGVQPDGDQPVNARVNKLIEDVAAAGGGTLIFPAGVYPVDSEGIRMGHQVTIMGMGSATIFRPVGTWESLGGVFRIGTDTSRSEKPVARTGLFNLTIKPGVDLFRHSEPIPNTVGILYNTYLGQKIDEPDAAHRISGITLWDLDMGIKLKGIDDQGCTVTEVRGRRFLRSALTVGDIKQATAADNSFSMIDLSSANRAQLDAATLEIYTSNCTFSQVKTWYSKRPLSFDASDKAGAGIYVRGTRNSFTQCDAQDNGGHGFVVDFPNNSFTNCIADSNGYADNVSGAAGKGEAHGFHINEHAQGTQLLGCQALNRVRKDPGQKIGFWVHENNSEVTLIGSTAANTESADSTDSLSSSQKVLISSDEEKESENA